MTFVVTFRSFSGHLLATKHRNRFQEVMDKIIGALADRPQLPHEYEEEKERDVKRNALIKEALPLNCFMTAAGKKVVVDCKKVEQMRAKRAQSEKTIQTTTIMVAENSQEECSPISNPIGKAATSSTGPITSVPVAIGQVAANEVTMTSIGQPSTPTILVPAFPAKRQVPDNGAGDVGLGSEVKRQCIETTATGSASFESGSPTSNRNQDSSRTKSANPATGLAFAIAGGGSTMSGGDSMFLKEKRPSLKFVSPVMLPGSRPTPSVSMPTISETKEKDEFDDEFDDSDNWWSGIGDVTVVVGGAKDAENSSPENQDQQSLVRSLLTIQSSSPHTCCNL